MIEIKQEKERFILIAVAVSGKDRSDPEKETMDSLSELAELVDTAGAETVGTLIQNREAPDRTTYLGKGKVEELEALIRETGATGVVSDDELSPAQLSNLSDALSVKVLDRTVVILDIFAQHAKTKEGKLQVELAQLKYRQSHLIGARSNLSRLGGGIGTRGPGESKLEIDRRLIRERIYSLDRELEDVVRTRDITRSQRMRSGIGTAAIVGYTNAGKSTLLNKLTGADVEEADKLFATLDPTVRELVTPDGEKILLTDTVGFVRKLPHNLIDAFRSTLEEAGFSDIIIQVVDVSNPDHEKHMEVTYDTLRGLGVSGKTFVTVFNKCDLLPDNEEIFRDTRADYTVRISAKTGFGLDELCSVLTGIIRAGREYVEKLFGFNEAGEIARIRKNGQILSEEYREDGIFIKAYVDKTIRL